MGDPGRRDDEVGDAEMSVARALRLAATGAQLAQFGAGTAQQGADQAGPASRAPRVEAEAGEAAGLLGEVRGGQTIPEGERPVRFDSTGEPLHSAAAVPVVDDQVFAQGHSGPERYSAAPGAPEARLLLHPREEAIAREWAHEAGHVYGLHAARALNHDQLVELLRDHYDGGVGAFRQHVPHWADRDRDDLPWPPEPQTYAQGSTGAQPWQRLGSGWPGRDGGAGRSRI